MEKNENRERYERNKARLAEIAGLMATENRGMTPEEQAETQDLEKEIREYEQKREKMEKETQTLSRDLDKMLRDAADSGSRNFALRLSRRDTDFMKTDDLDGTGIIPIHEQEMLKPLREGLIWNKVGLSIRSGLSGTLRWPKHGKAVAKFAGEGVALTDSKIDFSKLEMTGERLGIAIPVTIEELHDSFGVVESVLKEEMPMAIIDAINAVLFTTEKGSNKVWGPFANEGVQTVTFAGEVPTRKELLDMKAKVAASGIKMTNPCWVMTEAMKAELEDLKVDAGSGRFVCENDKVLGYPVFTTSVIGEGNIGFGDWGYQAAGFFGNWDFIIDPYTLARNHATDFVLNTRFGTVTLYEEAFVLGKKNS